MKILVAANFFKGSLSALEASEIIKRAILEENNSFQVETIPVADGGDGTLDAIETFTDCKKQFIEVVGPLGEKVTAKWLIFRDNLAVIEAAQANGLSLINPDDYNPLKTTTFGVGELIKQAMDKGCGKIYVTLGGSSTNDGGIGLLQALGTRFLDADNKELGFGGGFLAKLNQIDTSGLDKRLTNTEIICACDVQNPLCGENGASYVYAPQKGAGKKELEILDFGLKNLAIITEKTIGKDYSNYPGAGAAGGMGFALKSLLNAVIISGFQLISELSNIEEKISSADIVITTEGRFDSQSLSGKAPYQVVKLANKYGKPVILIAGSFEEGINFREKGITAGISLSGNAVSIEDSINKADLLLADAVKQVIKRINSFL